MHLRRPSRVLPVLLAFLLLSGLSLSAGAARAASDLGVVLLHGKGGSPKVFSDLQPGLDGAGCRTLAPVMPWAKDRYIDRNLDGSLDEIAAAVRKLKDAGAGRIVLVGHSLGANIALVYAAERGGLAGLVLLAPGHSPEAWAGKFAQGLDEARRLVAEGRGNERRDFPDMNKGQTLPANMPAAVYLDFFDPKGRAVMPANAARLPAGLPLLCVVGSGDPLSAKGPGYLFEKAPVNPHSAYVTVQAGHMGVPTAAVPKVLDWLAGLP